MLKRDTPETYDFISRFGKLFPKNVDYMDPKYVWDEYLKKIEDKVKELKDITDEIKYKIDRRQYIDYEHYMPKANVILMDIENIGSDYQKKFRKILY